ncbi:MAG: glutaminyl-peptide cyclotransferase [Sedimentisphaerales bacterium]|nr:glutaminyl-peptide cyclotransferase [Sedimentisphaerales bacterium]
MWKGRRAFGQALVCIMLIVSSCRREAAPVPRRYTYQVVAVIPHRPDAFTQGLVWDDGVIYEGTGLYGRSSLAKIRPADGQVIQLVALPPTYFGEGIAILADKVYQLTWQEQTAFVYTKGGLDQVSKIQYEGEGWGLTTDGHLLIKSDGSANLAFIDPCSFKVIRTIQVRDHKGPVRYLNELEFVRGRILANIWQTGLIAIIDPSDGHVAGYLDISDLWAYQPPGSDVPNGIAYDPSSDQLLVTGKLWSFIYCLRLDQGLP